MNHDLYITASGERDTSDSENAEEAARAMVSEDDVWDRVFSEYDKMKRKDLMNLLTSLTVAFGLKTAEFNSQVDYCNFRCECAIEDEVQNIISTRNAR